MNKFFLYLIMLPRGLWRSLGADVDQLQAILNVRLLMDNRRPINMGRPQKKPSKASIALQMFLSSLAGFIYIFPLFTFNDKIVGVFGYFSFFMVMLSFTLITDFSNILVDTRDKHIILPRPINDRTVFLSRILHVFIYLFRIVLPMSLPGWVAVGFLFGWMAPVWFIVPLLLMVCMVLFLVNGLYLLILRLTTPTRFKEIINYFQIAFSVLIFASYYLFPRLMEQQVVQEFNPINYPFLKWIPSYWLAATWSWLGVPYVLAGTKWVAALAIIFPVVCVYVTARFLAPTFTKKLGALDVTDAPPPVKAATSAKGGQKKSLAFRFANAFNKSQAAQSGFLITWWQTGRSRSFRMRVFPTFAYIPVYFVWLLTNNKDGLGGLKNLADGHRHLLLLYMSSFVLLNAITYITSSEQFKAAWIYYATPVEKPGRVMTGGFMAVWVKFFLPFFIAISAFVLWIWGTNSLLDIALALVNVSMFALIIVRVGMRRLPFSVSEQMVNSGGRFIRTFMGMLVPAALGFGHYLAVELWWLKALFLVLSSILLWLVWDSYSNTSWKDIKALDF